MGVNRDAKDLSVPFSELLNSLAQGFDLSWADEGEVQWIEDQKKVSSLECIKTDLFEGLLGLAPDLSFEKWCCFLYDCSHLFLFIIPEDFQKSPKPTQDGFPLTKKILTKNRLSSKLIKNQRKKFIQLKEDGKYFQQRTFTLQPNRP